GEKISNRDDFILDPPRRLEKPLPSFAGSTITDSPAAQKADCRGSGRPQLPQKRFAPTLRWRERDSNLPGPRIKHSAGEAVRTRVSSTRSVNLYSQPGPAHRPSPRRPPP